MNVELQKGSRSRILAAALIIIVALFVGRLFYLQIVQHDYYVALAQSEQQSRFIIPADRGMIYAKDGAQPIPLVMNQTVYTVFADPETVTDNDEIVKTLKEVAGGNLRPNIEDLLEVENSRYQILATKVTRVQADKIKEAGFNGIGFQETSQRVYPEGQLAAQVVGFVNNDGVGNYGVEGALNEDLNGTDGVLQAVTDVSNVPLTIGNDNIRVPEQDGKNIVLSIDRNIQSKAEQALAAALERTGATNGSALVMDPRTGEVMAMANLPTYNPTDYFRVTDAAQFNNNIISGTYEPGSTVKSFTLATAIDKGVVRPTDTYNNTDFIQVGDRTISNATKGKTGIISFQTAMQWSLNTGFVTIAQRLGNGREINQTARNTMYEYFHDRFRLGQPTGIELSGESSGVIIAPDQADGNAVRYSNMSFGQGMDATMMQVAAGFSALINGGNYFKPTIIDGVITDEGYKENPAPAPLQSGVVKPETAAEIKEVMRAARQAGFPGADPAGYAIGGKTGTSQVIKNGQYSATESIGSYIGYGGTDEAEYVIMVQVSGENKELQGARDAMPIFTDISNWMIEYLKIQPKG